MLTVLGHRMVKTTVVQVALAQVIIVLLLPIGCLQDEVGVERRGVESDSDGLPRRPLEGVAICELSGAQL